MGEYLQAQVGVQLSVVTSHTYNVWSCGAFIPQAINLLEIPTDIDWIWFNKFLS